MGHDITSNHDWTLGHNFDEVEDVIIQSESFDQNGVDFNCDSFDCYGTYESGAGRLESDGLFELRSTATLIGATGTVYAGSVKTDDSATITSALSKLIKTGVGDLDVSAGSDDIASTIFQNSGSTDILDDDCLCDTLIIGDSLDTNTSSNYPITATSTIRGISGSTLIARASANTAPNVKMGGGLIGDGCLDLDGSTEYVTIGDISSNANTIEVWFKPDVTIDKDTSGQAILQLTDSNNVIMLGSWTGSITNEIISVGTGTARDSWASATDSLNAGQWYYLVIVWDGSNYQIYLNGKQMPLTSVNAPSLMSASNILIGKRDAGGYFNGQVGGVSVWDTALTQTQIRAMMFYDWDEMAADNVTFTDSDCVGWWQFDENTGLTVGDSSASANHGTASHNTVWAAAPTFTDGTSTLDSSGAGEIYAPDNGEIRFAANSGVKSKITVPTGGTLDTLTYDVDCAAYYGGGDIVHGAGVDVTATSTTAYQNFTGSITGNGSVGSHTDFNGSAGWKTGSSVKWIGTYLDFHDYEKLITDDEFDLTNVTHEGATATPTIHADTGCTITAFTDHTIDANTQTTAFQSSVAHHAFNNIVITNSGTNDVLANDVPLSFQSSNFDETKVNTASTGSVISRDHNDVSLDFFTWGTTDTDVHSPTSSGYNVVVKEGDLTFNSGMHAAQVKSLEIEDTSGTAQAAAGVWVCCELFFNHGLPSYGLYYWSSATGFISVCSPIAADIHNYDELWNEGEIHNDAEIWNLNEKMQVAP